jgi:hypothetical protein
LQCTTEPPRENLMKQYLEKITNSTVAHN